MSKTFAHITAVGAFLPEDILTNSQLEQMVDTSDEWIVSRTGIRERRILKGEGKATSDMATPVVGQLCAARGISADQIDCIIVATTTPDYFFPSTANLTAHKAGAVNSWSFDLLAACSGFLYALQTGAGLVEAGKYKKVVVIGADKMSSIVDYTDRNTCVLFGDAAAGVLLEPTQDKLGVMDAVLRTDGVGADLLYMKGGGSYMPPSAQSVADGQHCLQQKGKLVFRYAIPGMVSAVRDVMERNNLAAESVRYLVPHQANMRILRAVAEEVGLPLERVCINIDKYGNTTAATIPLCLWEWQAMFRKGDNLVLTSFGAGFTWGAMWLKWG